MGMTQGLRGWGTSLSFLASVFTILSTVTNNWIHHEKAHSGLWQEGTQGGCSGISHQPAISVAGVCMVLAGGFGVLATLMGLRLLYRADESLRSQTTTALLFLSGLLLLLALISYSAASARKEDGFSWSYFAGLLLPAGGRDPAERGGHRQLPSLLVSAPARGVIK
ncbi:claudin domain-containing protein 2 isoform X3 [Cavia porcellus]|uniref:claudin domain-containing protein 2 isoform X3 n=1 Tax=Cavia porcellus TaxID=10141 RepID=UPI002FDF4A46